MRLRAVLLLPLTLVLLAVGAPLATSAVAYPVTNSCAYIQVSTQTPAVGESFTVTGVNFDAGGKVKLVLDTGGVLGRVTAGADGGFTKQVRMPSVGGGRHKLSAIGGKTNQPSSCPGDPFVFLGANGSSAPAGAPGTHGGGTAFTGVDVLLLVIVALALITVGVALNRRSRTGRRTSASVA
jgi:hypothetical protein